ncbi:hypothetical protein GCM10010176_102230 [Nonomuraea spiralis]|nr:hypothetical protein GCM10010176_102230 [Nonomuraea spiralis]
MALAPTNSPVVQESPTSALASPSRRGVLGGDAGGGFLTESYVVAEAGQLLVAGLGLQFRRGSAGLGQVLERAVAKLVQGPAVAVRMAGAGDQVRALAKRLPAAGLFEEFGGIDDHQEQFRFGREPDGTAADPWDWEDLD